MEAIVQDEMIIITNFLENVEGVAEKVLDGPIDIDMYVAH